MHSNFGHRQRVKQRFRDEGLEHFEESHALELLLFYAVPRRDTKIIARRLLDTFGSYAKVMEADADALCKVEGVGQSVATYIKLIHASSRYYSIHKTRRPRRFTTTADYGRYMVEQFRGLNKERAYLLCLNASNEPICVRQITEGTTTSVDFPIRKVLDIAMGCDATFVVLSHNHPEGPLKHSPEDLAYTKKIAAALRVAEITLLDHVIVANDNYLSLAECGLYDHRGMLL